MRTFFILLGIFVLVVSVSAALSVNAYREGSGLRQSKIIVDSVSIDNIDVGGMTKEEAENVLKPYITEKLNRTIKIRVGVLEFEPTYKEMGFSYDVEEAISKAYSLGRNKNPFLDLLEIHHLGVYNIKINELRNDEACVDYVASIAKKIDIKAKNATLYRKNGQIYITPSNNGKILDKGKAGQILIEALNKSTSEVSLPVKVDEPQINAKDLKKINKKLSSFTTKYNPGKVDRSQNLSTACKKIDSTILMPNDVFSFNKIVGPRNESTGFKNAIIFQNGEEIEGIGGGICQVSTTVFNSALLAGLDIVQRRNHTLKVHYVSPGRDAMVSYGSQDFKFKNSNSNPIVLFASVGGGVLNVEIWGNSSEYKKCEITSEVGDDGYYAKINRYEIKPNGSKVSTYTATSVYKREKNN